MLIAFSWLVGLGVRSAAIFGPLLFYFREQRLFLLPRLRRVFLHPQFNRGPGFSVDNPPNRLKIPAGQIQQRAQHNRGYWIRLIAQNFYNKFYPALLHRYLVDNLGHVDRIRRNAQKHKPLHPTHTLGRKPAAHAPDHGPGRDTVIHQNNIRRQLDFLPIGQKPGNMFALFRQIAFQIIFILRQFVFGQGNNR